MDNVKEKVNPPGNPNQINQLRNILNLSQEDFGKEIGVTQAAVSYWESGEEKPESGHYIKMATLADPPLCWDFLEAAGITLNQIMGKIQECRYGLYEKLEPPKEKRRLLQNALNG